MGLPNIPIVELEQALVDILDSIALEQTALASFINAEAKKIQALTNQINRNYAENYLNGQLSSEEIIRFQRNIASVMQTAVQMQMLLQFKLEKILDAREQLPLLDSSGKYRYKLLGSGKGTITNEDDPFFSGTTLLQAPLDSTTYSKLKHIPLSYKAQNLGSQLSFIAEPATVSIRCPYHFIKKPDPENPNMLILMGKGNVVRNAPIRSDLAYFNLTVWDGGSGPPGTDKFHLIIRADKNKDLNHDSGVVNLVGNLRITKIRS